MKGVLIILFSMSVAVCFGQLKHDANWVFGKDVRVDFNDTSNPSVYSALLNNNEANASISDAAGNLLLYASCDYTSPTSMPTLRGMDDSTISNGDSIILDFSATNGAVFLPVSDDTILFFHIGYEPGCGFIRCHRLYSTLIVKDNLEQWKVLSKNRILSNLPVEEAIGLVKHSNGKDWWLLIHEEKYNHPDSCSSKQFSFLINNVNVWGPFVQDNLAPPHCSNFSFGGEISVSGTGNWLAKIASGEDVIPIYKINRCSGTLDSINQINETGSYGIGIIGNYIYTSSIGNNGNLIINQYNLLSASLSDSRKLIFQVNEQDLEMGQLEPIGSNLIVSFLYFGQNMMLKEMFQRNVSRIVFADTDSAVIEHYSIYLGDSAKTSYGLPNFPNYNLGPEGVFLATAGKDTTLCSNTNSTGVTIGAPPVPNVIYFWQPATGLSATNTAQPIANPAQSTWYYLTATDTTATSCAVNTDSVYVKVETCTGITETPTLQAKLYPNPTNGLLTIEVPQGAAGYTFRLFNLLGQQVLEYPLEHDKTTFPLDFAKGIYLYQITAHGQVQHGKLVIGN